MAEPRWTKGPWTVKYGSGHTPANCEIKISGDIFYVAHMRGPNYAHTQANAHLISASPELYDALENINRVFDDYGKQRLPEYVRKEFAGVRQALKRARGETQ